VKPSLVLPILDRHLLQREALQEMRADLCQEIFPCGVRRLFQVVVIT